MLFAMLREYFSVNSARLCCSTWRFRIISARRCDYFEIDLPAAFFYENAADATLPFLRAFALMPADALLHVLSTKTVTPAVGRALSLLFTQYRPRRCAMILLRTV